MLDLYVRDGDRDVVLTFEHSLLSLSKWEQKHKKPFSEISKGDPADLIGYFEYMLLTPGVDPLLVIGLSPAQMEELVDYMNSVPSAKRPAPSRPRPFQKALTNEDIYAQMVLLKIPFQPAETWHLNRLMMLIQTISEVHEPPKKRPDREVMADWAAENARRLEQHKTTG